MVSNLNRSFLSIFALAALILMMTGCSNPLDQNKAKVEDPSNTTLIIPPDTNATFNPTHQPTASDSTEAAAIADAAYDELDSLIRILKNIETYDDWANAGFTRVRGHFEDALNLNPANIKANLGYTVASTMALNTSAAIKKMADSIHGWDSAYQNYDSTLATLAKACLIEALAQAAPSPVAPKFPRFVSVTYVQTIAAGEVVPVISNAIAALKRIEAQTDPTLTLTIDGEQFKIDKGEVLLLEASLRFIRASLNIFCMYDHDFYTAPGVKDFSGFLDMDRASGNSYEWRQFQRVSTDTLYRVYSSIDTSYDMAFGRILKYSLQPGTDYLTLHPGFNLLAKNDLMAIPVTLQAALAAYRAENRGMQSLDIIKMTDIDDLDSGFAKFNRSEDLVKAGISAALTSKFATPETFLNFITELLSGPYTLDTVDNKSLNLKINVMAFLNTPIQDLKTLLPKHQWLNESEWVVLDTSKDFYSNGWATNQVWVNNSDSFYIDNPARIDTIMNYGYSRSYVLTDSIRYQASLNINSSVTPIRFLNDNGQDLGDLNSDDYRTFPYFSDYTMGGFFPDMTSRQKWVDMINSFLSASEQIN
ncbi:MAG: hypothetical protein V1913_12055 [Fibrobacterota bacterium]